MQTTDQDTAFDKRWNGHYDFTSEANIREIAHVDGYDMPGDTAAYATGDVIVSPWGTNQVVEMSRSNDEDVCIKSITVNPGYMLSLQRHRGRSEVWEVMAGTLTAVLDGVRYDVEAGNSIIIPKGAVHCMINSQGSPVTVRETQRGTCREADNIRLMDFNGRPTYPLTSAVEHASAKLYSDIQEDHAARFGFEYEPHAFWKAA